ncbi:histidine kinase [Paenibacillus sp.]|uniref:sensor histidine kinase n=1 Tax=Paenibacillus sp. TaxID=58172 RepID=UPI002811509A|nr:histidine kinase [Paenibacillus sp.]
MRIRLSLARVVTVTSFALVITAFVAVVAILYRNDGLDRVFRVEPLHSVSAGPWEAIVGDLPFRGAVPAFDEGDWRPLAELQADAPRFGYVGYYWLRQRLPERSPRDPHLLLGHLGAFEAYLDEKQLLRFRMPPAAPAVNLIHSRTITKLSPEDAGKMLYLRVYTDGSRPPLRIAAAQYGQKDAIFAAYLGTDQFIFLIGLVFVLIGFAGFLLWLHDVRSRLNLAFALFMTSSGLGHWYISRTTLWYLEGEWFMYVPDVFLSLAVFSVLLFMEQLVDGAYRRLFRWLKRMSFGVFAGVLTTAYALPIAYRVLVTFVVPTMIVVFPLAALIALLRLHKRDPSPDRRWILSGLIGMYVGTTLQVIVHFLPPVRPWLQSVSEPLAHAAEFCLPAGLFWIVFCKGMVLFNRYMDLHRQVKAYAVETTERLASSLRETTGAIAHLSLAEARNRNARDVHDIVGHTLTTTAVQIEAARMLWSRSPDDALKTLATAGELVRKSLEDIRHSMQGFAKDEGETDLRETLCLLLEDASRTSGVASEYDIEDIPPLGSAYAQVLIHALQEGISNGIRHGRCGAFHFELRIRGDTLEFTLSNDGAAYEAGRYGFGLATMRERAEALGGSFWIGAAQEQGCRIDIRLPVR